MAFYTPPSLPRTPSAFTMNATLPSLRTSDLLSSWSRYRHSKQLAPLTPPMTSTFETRTTQPQPQQSTSRMTLPPIAHLERQLSAVQPLTPPEDVPTQQQQRLPPIIDHYSDVQQEDFFQSKPSLPEDAPHLVDWLDCSRTRSAHFIAEKTCEMICYLWFSSSSQEQPYASPNNSPPLFGRVNSSATPLQLVATPTFVQFMQKLLETTQVSQSVIVLSLHYIYRLKERNRFTPVQQGSEFRIAVAGLMMANKFLDDNTYTNKTWSEVSGIELKEINRMEQEFLMGVDFNLYVDKSTYESWLNLLKGLVMAKERASRHFRKSRNTSRSSRVVQPPNTTGPTSRTYGSKYRGSNYRARSTSPINRSVSYVYPSQSTSYVRPAIAEQSSPTPRSGSKRTAATAFSPTSATFANLPAKRPVGISLHIPEHGSNVSGPNSSSSYSPLEGLQALAKMSLASPHAPRTSSQSNHRTTPTWVSGSDRISVPETLVTAYSLDEGRRAAVPQNLYFYSLACSPMDNEEESRTRKARLRYHQPPPPSSSVQYGAHRLPPMPVVQSASVSPHDSHMNVMNHTLPHFHDNVWARPPVAAHAHLYNSQPQHHHQLHPQSETKYHQYQQQQFVESPVPSAPFANAGPPGVHFYPTPVQRSTSLYPHNWSRSHF